MIVFITGGAGFIGSSLIKRLILYKNIKIINIDKLTYAGNIKNLEEVKLSDSYCFEKVDICDNFLISSLLSKYKPDAIIHLAAESHVDRSIDSPSDFINTNILGTYNLLDTTYRYWSSSPDRVKKTFKFIHVSTDEVYGELNINEDKFNESSPYKPNSPYSASKASSDHLVRAWGKTYQFPYIISNCSNNYGPNQFPEKFIPNTIISALTGNQINVYGDGRQIRDWLYVDDHADALIKILYHGSIFNTYNIGGNYEKKNIDVVKSICEIMEDLVPNKPHNINRYLELVKFVEDRPGHDFRYAIDSTKIEKDLKWSPRESFETGIKKTITWFLKNDKWWKNIISGKYKLNRIGKIKN